MMGVLSVYHSTLEPGAFPHSPHVHEEEEIIVLLSGQLVVWVGEGQTLIGPGSFFYHPPGERHTIQGAGDQSSHFIVLKWQCQPPDHEQYKLETFIHQATTDSFLDSPLRVLHTHHLRNDILLRAVLVSFDKNGGYPLHKHEHDVVLILLSGCLHDITHNTPAPAVIYYPAGVPHCHRSDMAEGVTFLAFEFHAEYALNL
ncbi:MAG: cupin domain-containing protein [Magnetococcales bacterium]|nr:cupin domain-containing protein [Magnetococcales bacterium]